MAFQDLRLDLSRILTDLTLNLGWRPWNLIWTSSSKSWDLTWGEGFKPPYSQAYFTPQKSVQRCIFTCTVLHDKLLGGKQCSHQTVLFSIPSWWGRILAQPVARILVEVYFSAAQSRPPLCAALSVRWLAWWRRNRVGTQLALQTCLYPFGLWEVKKFVTGNEGDLYVGLSEYVRFVRGVCGNL